VFDCRRVLERHHALEELKFIARIDQPVPHSYLEIPEVL
jgi:hypothetical protein